MKLFRLGAVRTLMVIVPVSWAWSIALFWFNQWLIHFIPPWELLLVMLRVCGINTDLQSKELLAKLFASIEVARGLGSSEGSARMRARPSESPVSIQEAFPSTGGKHPRPKSLSPEAKRRMTSPRVHSARWNCHSAEKKFWQGFARSSID